MLLTRALVRIQEIHVSVTESPARSIQNLSSSLLHHILCMFNSFTGTVSLMVILSVPIYLPNCRLLRTEWDK
jgi:hypothetical protein